MPIVITDSLANDERAATGMVFAPTGQRPLAQGCEARATLGHPIKLFINPNGVASFVSRRMQPIQGCTCSGRITQGSLADSATLG